MNENDIQKNLQKAKPKTDHDPAFAAQLRGRLLADFSKKTSVKKINSFIIMAKNMRYAIAGLAVIVVAGIGVFVSMHQKTGSSSQILASNVTVTKVQSDAFGSLGSLATIKSSNTTNNTQNAAATAAAPSPATAPTQTNGSGAVSAAPAIIVGGSTGTSGSAIAMPIRPPYYYPSVKYVYKGAAFSQDQAQLDVLKYIPTPYSADQLSTTLAQANFGNIDLSTFQNLNVSNVTLSEDQDFGYQMYIDLENGTISINQNYLKWPQNNNPQPLTNGNNSATTPTDNDIIAIANTFLSDHNISRANFGDPEVIHQLQAYPMMGAATGAPVPTTAPATPTQSANIGAMPMIPYYFDSEQVLYPLMVNGQTVYTSGGSKVGLTVEVNLQYNRVANVYGLSTQNYQASAYDAITDTSTIISLAENPQFYPEIYNGVSAVSSGPSGVTSGSAGTGVVPQQTEIDLGTPTMEFVQMYQSDANGQSAEFLVPAYVFPIISNDTTSGDDQNVVVPIIKDFVQQTTTIYPPRPLPPTIKSPTPAK